MPIRDAECLRCGAVHEHYYHTFAQPPVPCDACGEGARFLPASRFGIVFTGALAASKYGDRSLASYTGEDGFWATEKNTLDGQPRQRYISTWDERKEYMKREGLTDAGPREAAADGVSRNEGAGLSGQWV